MTMKELKPYSIKQMVHGKPSSHCSENAMYDILTWIDSLPNMLETNKQSQKHCAQSFQKKGPLLTEYQIRYDGPHRQYSSQTGMEAGEEYQISQKKHLKAHEIKKELYMYETKNQKSVEAPVKKVSFSMPKSIKLNEDSTTDQKVIEHRKEKIKQFKYETRQLPNSSFTTYFGKPTFESYGNQSSKLKTHNVMPHRGKNQPITKQTYQGALTKAKKTKTTNHLPRKPIQQSYCYRVRVHTTKRSSQPINLPMEEPDLVNHVRFSEPKPLSDRKEAVPTLDKLKRSVRNSERGNMKTKVKKSISMDDGLKFMNCRKDLLKIIQNNKKRDSRLPYKVTECYPEETRLAKTQRISPESRPAGMLYYKSESAYNLIYHKY